MSQTQMDPATEQARLNFEKAADAIGLVRPGTTPNPSMLNDLRRGRRPEFGRTVGEISLVERNGILEWHIDPVLPPFFRDQRRARIGLIGRILGRREFTALGENEIGRYLTDLDSKLTPPPYGLLQLDLAPTVLQVCQNVVTSGRILLLIHGTFSNSSHLIEEIAAAPNQPPFLERARKHYDQVLAFNHPTLSVSPFINAMELRDALGGSSAQVDIVCHSRGGLVARWWMEILDVVRDRRRRAVFVGSPLTGTSLAAPDKLRAGLNVLANFSKALGAASMAVPFMQGPAAIMRIIGSVVGVSSRVPLVDAAVALIPGLNGQSKVLNCAELECLNRRVISGLDYYFVRADFSSRDAGWNFCRLIREARERLAEAATDLLVFPGPNDIVVDTASMTEVKGIVANQPGNLLDYGETPEVHHTNYFRQRRTIDFICQALQIP